MNTLRREEIPDSPAFELLARGAQFRDRIVVRVRATPARIFAALDTVALNDMKLAWLLGELRYLPARLRGRRPAQHKQPFLEQLADQGTLVLSRSAKELVTGSAGRLHRIQDQTPVSFRSADEFQHFTNPEYEKLFMSVRVAPTLTPGEYWLVLDHATLALSTEAERKFKRYWRVIRPLGALVSRALLRAVRRSAARPDIGALAAQPH